MDVPRVPHPGQLKIRARVRVFGYMCTWVHALLRHAVIYHGSQHPKRF